MNIITNPISIKYSIPIANHFGTPLFSNFLQYGYKAYDTANPTKNGNVTAINLDSIPIHNPLIK